MKSFRIWMLLTSTLAGAASLAWWPYFVPKIKKYVGDRRARQFSACVSSHPTAGSHEVEIQAIA